MKTRAISFSLSLAAITAAIAILVPAGASAAPIQCFTTGTIHPNCAGGGEGGGGSEGGEGGEGGSEGGEGGRSEPGSGGGGGFGESPSESPEEGGEEADESAEDGEENESCSVSDAVIRPFASICSPQEKAEKEAKQKKSEEERKQAEERQQLEAEIRALLAEFNQGKDECNDLHTLGLIVTTFGDIDLEGEWLESYHACIALNARTEGELNFKLHQNGQEELSEYKLHMRKATRRTSAHGVVPTSAHGAVPTSAHVAVTQRSKKAAARKAKRHAKAAGR